MRGAGVAGVGLILNAFNVPWTSSRAFVMLLGAAGALLVVQASQTGRAALAAAEDRRALAEGTIDSVVA